MGCSLDARSNWRRTSRVCISRCSCHSGDGQLSAYIGLEPGGKAHLGWIILGDTIGNLLDEGVNVIILLADWHAWVNDKFGRDMEKISQPQITCPDVSGILENPGGDRTR